MLKKVLAFVLVISLTATLAISGTLAYLTDRDSEANVFTVGDVNIDLNEDFNQGATLIPGVDIVKKPTITNDGPNEAYVWATVAVPAELASVIDFSGEGVGWETWTKAQNTTEIDGKEYTLYTVLHTKALGVGDVTEALFSNVALDETVDIDPDGKWYTVVNGTATDLGWNNSDGNSIVYVSAYAIQKDGIDTVNAAYNAYQTQWADNGTAYPPALDVIDTPAELEDALNSGTPALLGADIVLDEPQVVSKEAYIDLNGYTLTTSGLEFKSGGTISRGSIKSDKNTNLIAHVKASGGTLTIEDVDVYISHYLCYDSDGASNYAEFSGVDATNANLVLNNCTVKVSNDTRYTWNFLYGITVNNGTVTMNGGSIVFDSIFAQKIQYNAVVSSFGTDVVNLNDVDLQNANSVLAYGKELTINTNVNTLNSLYVERGNGSTCTINYNP